MNLNGHYAITPEALDSLFPLAKQLQAASANTPPAAPAAFQIINDAAIINIAGAIFPKANIFTLFGFGVAIDSLAAQLSGAENHPAVNKIIFNFDSPGGYIAGINEFSNQISGAAKPTTAYVSGMAASAAYWLAAACNEIVTDATAVLGSIGIVAVMSPPGSGVIEVVSTHASDKRPDPSTDSGKNTIRATLNELEAVFHQSVSMHRPALTIEAMEALRGGVRVGANAVSVNLADRVDSQSGVVYRQSQSPINSPSATGLKDENQGWSRAMKNAVNPPKTTSASLSDVLAKAGLETLFNR
jgi:ClpP class serine protease